MLIEFSVANFLSIKDRQTLRMDAARISEYPERVIDVGRHKLLRSAAIYGANASGKSNVLNAMGSMKEIITKSAERSSVAEIDVEPFLLSTETEHSPSYFEIIFLINEIQYRYGFEADRNVVRAEWLFEAKKNVEKSMFLRENDVIEISKEFKEGKGLEEKTRNNALFLAVCDQFNGERAKAIIGWFRHLMVVSGINHMNYNVILGQVFRIDTLRNYFLRILKQVNLGFSTIEVQEAENNESFINYLRDQDRKDITDIFDGHFLKSVKSSHTKYNSNKEVVSEILFDTDKQESEGTKKFLDITSFISLSMGVGGCMVIDELDAKLHPLLTQAVIRLFNNPETNPNNVQLIFATHDTNLLTYGQFRRDQIWFTEKDKYGATCLYSLVEYQEEDGTKVRKDRSFETDYIQGRYGAIPFIGDFSKLFQHGA